MEFIWILNFTVGILLIWQFKVNGPQFCKWDKTITYSIAGFNFFFGIMALLT